MGGQIQKMQDAAVFPQTSYQKALTIKKHTRESDKNKNKVTYTHFAIKQNQDI